MRNYYTALVHKDPDSDYGISFPDFPGCVTAGSTLNEAMELAQEALDLHVSGMAEDGDIIPTASPPEEVLAQAQADNEDDSLVGTALVPVTLPSRSIRINVTMDQNLLEEIARATSNRSAFLAQAAKAALREI